MNPHPFIFKPGLWEGKGRITFSMAEDVLDFSMNWTVLPIDEKKIHFNQAIDIYEFPDNMRNHFSIYDITSEGFEIELRNNVVGKVAGRGLLTPKVIAWEFHRKDQEFEGYEIYELQENGTYKVRSEFTAGEGLRTHIEAEIWPV